MPLVLDNSRHGPSRKGRNLCDDHVGLVLYGTYPNQFSRLLNNHLLGFTYFADVSVHKFRAQASSFNELDVARMR